MALLTWNDVKVLNPNTGLYEAYITRSKIYNPGTGVSCQNGTGWGQCAFIANGSFDTGEMLDGITPLMGQYIRYEIPPSTEACDAIIKVIDEDEFNNGQMICPSGYYPYGGSPMSCPCTVDYNTLSMTDYSSLAQFPPGLPTLDFITYCCKKCTNYSPVSLSMVCVGGCTDPLALNYDPTQLIDDGSCVYNGCMDSAAVNYNPQAVFDDGSCVYAGCTDPLASNYDPLATIDDGSCLCIKCCERVDAFGVVSHILLNSTTTPCQCPSGWYDVICGQYLGWECDPSTGSCLLVQNGAYSSQTECDTDCADCGCTKLLGTGHTSAYAIALSADCEEYCCDPDLKQCSIFVVGDDEGIQVYDPINNNTSHLFDSNFADILDITAMRTGNNGFIWVYKHYDSGLDSEILEYAITCVPFTFVYVRSIQLPGVVLGNGLTYFGNDFITNQVILTVASQTGGKVQNITLPIAPAVGVTITTEYTLPIAANGDPYECTGDLLTEGIFHPNALDAVLYDDSAGGGTTYKVGIISRNTGVVLEDHTISSLIMTGTTKFEGLFVDTTLGLPGKIMGVTTDGRIYELLQSGPGGNVAANALQFAATSTGQIDFVNNVTNTVYGADNLSWKNELCTRGAILMPDSYDCIVSNWGCTDPGTGLGQYSSLADCQAFCIVSANCDPGQATGNCKLMDTHPKAYIINTGAVGSVNQALQWISQQWHGLQSLPFQIIGWPNAQNPSTMQGVCWMKWWNVMPGGTLQQKWKITKIECELIHPTFSFTRWDIFVSVASSVLGNTTNISLSQSYQTIQSFLFGTYGFMPPNEIKIFAEPCICWGWPCDCVPVLGPSGTYNAGPTPQDNLDACEAAPCCPCKKCCRKTTPPYNTITLATTTNPCQCPAGYSQVPWSYCNPIIIQPAQPKLANPNAACMKTCTNGSYYIPLETDDEYCDCNTYGLEEAPPECDKCCTDGTITKKLPLYSTICECDTDWYECSATPVCEEVCISTSTETTKRLYKPEWPECDCPTGYELYVDEIVNTTITSSDSIICSRCIGGEVETKTFGSDVCPGGWTLSISFNASDCGTTNPPINPPIVETPCPEGMHRETADGPCVNSDYPPELPPVDSGDHYSSRYTCGIASNDLVGEEQRSCIPNDDGEHATIEACLYAGCGGFMSCKEDMNIDGVYFGGETYDPIVMCCESVINTSYERLTTAYCTAACHSGSETWYPLYNAFGPNTIHDSLLSYMVRELLDPVRNGDCKTSGTESTFTSQGYTRASH